MTGSASRWLLALLALGLAAACGEKAAQVADASADAGVVPDAGGLDGGVADAGVLDGGGGADAGIGDDAGALDAGVAADGGEDDAGVPGDGGEDAGAPDGGASGVESEPNDGPAMAQNLGSLPATVAGAIAAPGTTGDVDWYRFSGTEGRWVEIRLTSTGAAPFEPRFELVSAPAGAAAVARASSRVASTQASPLAVPMLLPATGDYLVAVSDARNAGSSPVGGAGYEYRLEIAETAPPEVTPIPLALGTEVAATTAAGPVLYSVSLLAPGAVVVTATAAGHVPALAVQRVEDGSILAYRQGRRIAEHVALGIGAHQIVLDRTGGVGGAVALKVTAVSADIAETEPNETPQSASGLASPPVLAPQDAVVVRGALGAGDLDHFAFKVRSGTVLTATRLRSGSARFTFALLDADGVAVAAGAPLDDLDPLSAWRLTVPGTGDSDGPFFLRMAPRDDTATGDYALALVADGCAASPFAPPSPGEVRYTEALPNPAPGGESFPLPETRGICGDANADGIVGGEADQFVELVNVASRPVDLGGLEHRDRDGHRYAIACGTVLWPNQALLLFGGGDPARADPTARFGHAEVRRVPGADHLALDRAEAATTAEELTLRTPSGAIVDAVSYSVDPPRAQSLSRAPADSGPLALPSGGLLPCEHPGPLAVMWSSSPGVRGDGQPFAPALPPGDADCASAPEATGGGVGVGSPFHLGADPLCADVSGPRAIYRVTVGAGQTVAVKLEPTRGWLGYVALRAGCASACLAIAYGALPGEPVILTHAPAAGVYYVVVGGVTPLDEGPYRVRIAVH